MTSNPYMGKPLRELMAIRRDLERRYDGPIPAWTLCAWKIAYQAATAPTGPEDTA